MPSSQNVTFYSSKAADLHDRLASNFLKSYDARDHETNPK